MPISRQEYDAGGFNPEQAVLELLRTNESLAFTVPELIEMFTQRKIDMTEAVLMEILQSLESKSRITSKVVRGRLYYTYQRSIGFLPR